MASIRLPATATNFIESYNTGNVNTFGSYVHNGVVHKYPDGNRYVTQRPAMELISDPDGTTTQNRGRGVEYWADVNNTYLINNRYIYKNNYAGICTPNGATDIASGTSGTTTTLNIGAHTLVAGDLVSIDQEISFDTTPLPAGEYEILTASTPNITIDYITAGAYTPPTPADTVTPIHFKSGTGKIYIAELSSELVFVDPTGNTACYITSGSDSAVVNMNAAAAFDAMIHNNSLNYAHGLAVLDKTMYMLDTQGTIWGSTLNDVTAAWSALNYINAEKEEDGGVWIGKHHDNIVVMGNKTIQFFYDAANATGSPLAARSDISYNIGCADGESVWRNGDDLYFLGVDSGGEIAAYMMRSFQLKKISDPNFTSFLTKSLGTSFIDVIGSGFSSGGQSYYILTTFSKVGSGDRTPKRSFVYCSGSSTWSTWAFADATNIPQFGLVDFTTTATAGESRGIVLGGELLAVSDSLNPVDYEDANSYYVTDYISDNYLVQATDKSWTIPMTVRIDHWDGGTRDWKFASQFRYVGDATYGSQTMTIKWADENNSSFTTGRTIDISDPKNKLTRLGRFKSRSFQFEITSDEQIRFEGADIELAQGTH